MPSYSPQAAEALFQAGKAASQARGVLVVKGMGTGPREPKAYPPCSRPASGIVYRHPAKMTVRPIVDEPRIAVVKPSEVLNDNFPGRWFPLTLPGYVVYVGLKTLTVRGEPEDLAIVHLVCGDDEFVVEVWIDQLIDEIFERTHPPRRRAGPVMFAA